MRWKVDKAEALLRSRLNLDRALQLLNDGQPQAQGGVLAQYFIVRGALSSCDQDWFRKALSVAAEAHDGLRESTALASLAACSSLAYRYDRAIELAQKALAIAQSIGAQRVMGMAYNNLGMSHARLGDFDRASLEHDKAIELFRKVGDNANLSNALGERGSDDFLQQRFALAVANYKEAFSLRSRTLWAANIATAEIYQQHWSEAGVWNQKARALAERARDEGRLRQLDLNDALIAENSGHVAEARQVYQRLAAETEDPAIQWRAYANLAVTDMAAHRHIEANREFQAALSLIDRARAPLKDESKILFIARLMEFYQNYVAALIEQGQSDAALAVVESSRARVLTERLGREHNVSPKFDLARLRKLAAASKSTFLAYWIAPRASYAWVIQAKGTKLLKLPPAAEIEAMVNTYRAKLERLSRDPAVEAKLWQSLLAEAAPLVPKDSCVIVVPDGPLHRLNLEALAGPNGHPWIEDAEVSIAPSLSVLTSKPSRQARTLLAIGAPDTVNPDFPKLPMAAAEIEAMRSHFAASKVFTGAGAVPSAYRAASPANFSLIHFAAHAETNRESPLDSAVILSRGGTGYKLFARDVIDVPIQAELVTISACRSAGVRAYGGEGLIGFAWAFLQAGARSVIGGLWDVSDTSTEPLMAELYKRVAEGQTPAASLRAAKLALRAGKYPKPFHWAPFQIYVRSL